MTIYTRVLRFILPYRKQLAFSILCSIIYSVFSGVSIYLTIPLLETLFGGGGLIPQAPEPSAFLPLWANEIKEAFTLWFQHLVFRAQVQDTLFNVCVAIVCAFLIKNLFGYLQSNLMIYVEQGLTKDLRNALYRHIHELPLGYFTNERTGNLISRIMNDVPMINTGISATFQTLIRQPLLIIVYLAITIMISWKLTLIAFIVFPLVLLVIALVGRRVHKGSGLA